MVFLRPAPGPRKLAKGGRFVAAFPQHGTALLAAGLDVWSLLLSLACHAAAPAPPEARARRPQTATGDGPHRQIPSDSEHALRRAESAGCTRSPATGGAMGGWPRTRKAAPRSLLVALVLCSLLAQPQPSRAFFFGVRTSAHVPQQRGGGGREEKVPMTVVVPDYSPRPAALGPSPAPAPGSDGGGGDEDGTPRLPSERRSTGAPSSAHHHHSTSAQAPAGATSADFISSNPAVPLPAGVTDSATVLPMPTPGHQLREHDDVGMGTLRLQVRAVQLAVPLLMMLSFGATSVSVRGVVL